MTINVGVGTVIFKALRKFEVVELNLRWCNTEFQGSGTLKGRVSTASRYVRLTAQIQS